MSALAVGSLSALLALRDYPVYEARLQVRVLADPVVGDEVVVADDSESESFIATELVTLNGDALREDVRRTAGVPDLQVEAVQVGTSSVVEIVGRSADRRVSTAVTGISDRYVARRRAELLERIESIGAEVSRQLVVAAAEITRLSEQSGSVTAEIQRGAVTAEYTRLIEQRNTLQLASDATERLVQVVTPVAASGVQQITNPLRNGLLGAFAGGLLGWGAVLVLGRLRRRMGGLEDLLDLAPELAFPTAPRVRAPMTAEQAGALGSRYVSALTVGDRPFGQPPLVVVAPTEGCGATTLAVGMAVASARRVPTLLVAAGDVLDGAAAALLGVSEEAAASGRPVPTSCSGLSYLAPVCGTGSVALAALEGSDLAACLRPRDAAIVVDAPALSSSSAGLDLSRLAGRALLVGGVDHTTPAELDLAARGLRRIGVEVVGVVLDNASRGGRRRGLPWRRRP